MGYKESSPSLFGSQVYTTRHELFVCLASFSGPIVTRRESRFTDLAIRSFIKARMANDYLRTGAHVAYVSPFKYWSHPNPIARFTTIKVWATESTRDRHHGVIPWLVNQTIE